MTLPVYHPSSELVAVTWITSVSEGVPVGTELPETDEWTATGFVQVAVLQGTPDLYSQIGDVVVDVSVWVGSTSSQAIDYPKALDIAWRIHLAHLQVRPGPLVFDNPEVWRPVKLASVYPVSTPRELRPGVLAAPDEAGFGRVGFELGFIYGEG